MAIRIHEERFLARCKLSVPFDAIGLEQGWGGGIDLPKGLEVRITQHLLFTRFGARNRYLGAADLGSNGPWGRYNAISIRKYFGKRRYGN